MGTAGIVLLAADRGLAADGPKRIGILVGNPFNPTTMQQINVDIRRGLAAEAWPEDAVEIKILNGDNDPALIDQRAAELLAWHPDVLIGIPTPGTAGLVKATADVPIVFSHVSDPVGMHFVQSFAAPGGNVTGFSNFEASMGGKWLELLKQLVPGLTRVAMITNPAMLAGMFYVPAAREAASRIGLAFEVIEVDSMPKVEAAVADAASALNTGLVFSSDAFVHSNYAPIVAAVNARGVPAMYPFPQYPQAGGLIAYTVDEDALYENAGHYAGRILNGARPQDLPVQAPTKFDLIINLATAAAQGITVPSTLLATATQVIE
jgi:putative ABC transport system substrate-binding protein